jgi:hypothetical protein
LDVEVREAIEESETVAEVILPAEEEGDEKEAEDGDVRKGKRRRPRRRRRGGKAKEDAVESPRPQRQKAPASPESIVVDLGPAGHEVELFTDDEEDDDQLLDSSDEDDDEGDETSSGGARPASHRNIPSWAEAIGVVVDSNLALRTERKKTARPPGSNRGGRARGRRKKRS